MQMTNYKQGVWYGWNGGECPVPAETEVEIQTYGEESGHSEGSAYLYNWDKADWKGNTIIAFRVIQHAPREWVIARDKKNGRAVLFDSVEAANKMQWMADEFTEIISVREVLE